jgi:hypothetical protein
MEAPFKGRVRNEPVFLVLNRDCVGGPDVSGFLDNVDHDWLRKSSSSGSEN